MNKRSRHHERSANALLYRKLYSDRRWSGIRRQAFLRDNYTCQRCHCIVIDGNRHHPHAAVANHKTPHRGDEYLFFDLANVETVCKSCHDALIQREEKRGYIIGCDTDGRPIDPEHPWNAVGRGGVKV